MGSMGAARSARDLGMMRAERHAGEDWAEYADRFIRWYARDHREVFVDDLWEAGLEEPASPRALGPRMLAAVRSGILEKTGEYRPSVRSNLTVKPVWRSTIYEHRP